MKCTIENRNTTSLKLPLLPTYRPGSAQNRRLTIRSNETIEPAPEPHERDSQEGEVYVDGTTEVVHLENAPHCENDQHHLPPTESTDIDTAVSHRILEITPGHEQGIYDNAPKQTPSSTAEIAPGETPAQDHTSQGQATKRNDANQYHRQGAMRIVRKNFAPQRLHFRPPSISFAPCGIATELRCECK